MPHLPHDDPEIDAFASSLDDMLERVNSATRVEQEARERDFSTPARRTPRADSCTSSTPAPAPAQAAVPQHSPARPHPVSMPGSTGAGRRRWGWGAAGLVALGAVVAGAALRYEAPPKAQLTLENLPPTAAGSSSTTPAPPAPSAPATAASTSTAAAPSLPAIASDPDASTEALMLAQWGPDSSTTAAGGTPSFAIARYDSLPSSKAGRVLVPLGLEEVYALVPATSRLRELDDLRGRRINIGVPDSPRARSAQALYRTLFGQALPPSPLRSASKDVALPALLRGEGLDAMLLFDGQPSSWLAALPVETRLRLKVLRFDPTRSSGQRALQSYLSARVDPPLVGEPAPVPTLGEVTFLVAMRGDASSPELVRRLCERLPALRASGHPKWNEVDPAAQLPLPFPRSPDIAPALRACASARSLSTPSPGAPS